MNICNLKFDHIKNHHTIKEIFDIYKTGNYNSELLLQHSLIHLMNISAQNKKQELLKTIGDIESNSQILYSLLNKIYDSPYTPPSLEDEKKFVDTCHYLQMCARQALQTTGYYKKLSGVPRKQYAPEELEGDLSEFSEFIKVEFNKLEEQIKEGNKYKPIQEPDSTKEEWLQSVERAKTYYSKIYNEAKEFFDNNEDKYWCVEPVETHIILDEKIINMAKGYMIGPVGLFRNNLIEAIVQSFDNLPEMQLFLEVQSKTKDMVLYMIYEQAGKHFFRGNFVYKM